MTTLKAVLCQVLKKSEGLVDLKCAGLTTFYNGLVSQVIVYCMRDRRCWTPLTHPCSQPTQRDDSDLTWHDMGKVSTRKHPKWQNCCYNHESDGRFSIGKPCFLFEFPSNYMSISLSFRHSCVTDRHTDYLDYYYIWPPHCGGPAKLANNFYMQYLLKRNHLRLYNHIKIWRYEQTK